MDFFLGTYNYAIDDTGRLNIPSKFRKVLASLEESNLIISKEQPGYLTVYPYLLWKRRIGDKVAELPRSDAQANKLRRLLGLNTAEASLDKQGRVNIPTDYYAHAGIDKSVRIIGTVDTIQLWNPVEHDGLAESPEGPSLLAELDNFHL